MLYNKSFKTLRTEKKRENIKGLIKSIAISIVIAPFLLLLLIMVLVVLVD